MLLCLFQAQSKCFLITINTTVASPPTRAPLNRCTLQSGLAHLNTLSDYTTKNCKRLDFKEKKVLERPVITEAKGTLPVKQNEHYNLTADIISKR